MQPWPNRMDDGRTVYVRGLGDAIALVLRGYLAAQTEAEPAELCPSPPTESKHQP